MAWLPAGGSASAAPDGVGRELRLRQPACGIHDKSVSFILPSHKPGWSGGFRRARCTGLRSGCNPAPPWLTVPVYKRRPQISRSMKSPTPFLPPSLAALALVLAVATSIRGSEPAPDTGTGTRQTLSSSAQPTASSSSVSTSAAGAPTGKTPADSIDPVFRSAARAVRQIWDANPDLAKLDLRVTPTATGLLFEGMVPDARAWERAKDTAEGVITRIHIDNRIRVRGDFPKAQQ